MPAGESFIRQILSGREYFKKHFNVTPTTAINFDPFGHSRGLVQILAKSGYNSYMFGRLSATIILTFEILVDAGQPSDIVKWTFIMEGLQNVKSYRRKIMN